MKPLLNFVLSNRWLVLIGMLLLLSGGALVVTRIPLEAFPDLTNNQVVVSAKAPGMSPVEVEQLITFPLESAMLGLPHLQVVRSTSKLQITLLTIVFDDSIDLYRARQLVAERLNQVQGTMPPGITPVMGPMSTAFGEIYQFTVQSPSLSLMQLKTLLDWTIRYQLATVPQVSEINSWGGETKQYSVLVDPDALRQYNLTLHEVITAIQSNNSNFGGSYIEHSDQTYAVRGLGRAASLDDLGNTVVASSNGTPVLVKQVAKLQTLPLIRQGAILHDSAGETVSGMVIALRGANGNKVIQQVKEKIAAMQLPGGAKIIPFYDQSNVIHSSIGTVRDNLLIGASLVILILLVFLGNWRAALVVALTIPLSLLFAFLGMAVFGISANLMSLGAIDFGTIVDGSVIMVENSMHRLESDEENPAPNDGPDPHRDDRLPNQTGSAKQPRTRDILPTIRSASTEVARPIIFGVLIILAVYIPVLTLQDLAGRMFRPMAVTVMSALVGSLFLALFVVPTFCSLALRPRQANPRGTPLTRLAPLAAFLRFRQSLLARLPWNKPRNQTNWHPEERSDEGPALPRTHQQSSSIQQNCHPEERSDEGPPFRAAAPASTGQTWFTRLRTRYARSLDRAEHHRKLILFSALALVLLSVASLFFIGTEFMPTLDEGSLVITSKKLPGISLSESIRVQQQIDKTIRSFPEVSSVVAKMGRPDLATEAMGVYETDAYINFYPRAQWRSAFNTKQKLADGLADALNKIPGVAYEFTQPMEMRVDETITGARGDLALKIFGKDLGVLERLGHQANTILAAVPGASQPQLERIGGATNLEVQVDRAEAARYGLNVSDIQEVIESLLGSRQISEMVEGEQRFAIAVRLPSDLRNNLGAIHTLQLKSPSGQLVQLDQVAHIHEVSGPILINREDAQRRVLVSTNVEGRDLGSYVKEAQQRIAQQLPLPPGYSLQWGGQYQNEQQAEARLAIALPLSLLIICALLYASFQNVRQTILILLIVPLALVGGIAALWLRGINLNLSASIGFIALFGVAVLDGVVMVSHINNLRQKGLDMARAVRQGAADRLRPVLITATVASLGFIPAALSTARGAEVQRPLATVVIGGLITATLLTLYVLPLLYPAFSRHLPAGRPPSQPTPDRTHEEAPEPAHA